MPSCDGWAAGLGGLPAPARDPRDVWEPGDRVCIKIWGGFYGGVIVENCPERGGYVIRRENGAGDGYWFGYHEVFSREGRRPDNPAWPWPDESPPPEPPRL